MNVHVIVSAVDYDVGAGDALITGNQFRGMKFKGINDNHLGDIKSSKISYELLQLSFYFL